MRSYANTQQPFTPADAGINLFGIPTFPQIALGTTDNNVNKTLSFGPSGAGLYYDRGELFTYFSPAAGGGYSGPFR